MRVVLGVTAVILLSVCRSVAGSTSIIPTPTSTPIPSPTPSPTPTPCQVPVYIGYDSKGNQLFRLQGTINVSVTFNTTTVLPFQVPCYEVQVTVVNTTSSNQGSMTANLNWTDPGPCNDNCNFTLVFKMSADYTRGSQGWHVKEVDFIFNAEAYNITPTTPNLKLSHEEELYKTQLGRAYQCSTVTVGGLVANASLSNATALVHIQTFELQAFHFSANDDFDASPLVCGQDMPDNKIVPIAVGAALALLVIIVVIAYIIGRFRNRGKKSDYEVISS